LWAENVLLPSIPCTFSVLRKNSKDLDKVLKYPFYLETSKQLLQHWGDILPEGQQYSNWSIADPKIGKRESYYHQYLHLSLCTSANQQSKTAEATEGLKSSSHPFDSQEAAFPGKEEKEFYFKATY
jgi:hypothetical protein